MYQRNLKRLFDILISMLIIIFMLPFMVLVSVLIAMLDPGPIFFLQNRVGKNRQLFTLIKFRTMPVGTKDVPSDSIAIKKLPLISRILRRTNLDELPQLINVINGDMSLVGPRPCLQAQRELIELRMNNGSIACRPGITGLAQVNSFSGMSNRQKAYLDGVYSSKISFITDIKICILTVFYLLKQPPVY